MRFTQFSGELVLVSRPFLQTWERMSTQEAHCNCDLNIEVQHEISSFGKKTFQPSFPAAFFEPLPKKTAKPCHPKSNSQVPSRVAPCERPFGAKVRIHPAGFHSAWRHKAPGGGPRGPRGTPGEDAGAGMELSREPPVGIERSYGTILLAKCPLQLGNFL